MRKSIKMETIKGYKFIKEDMKSYNGEHKWEIGQWYKIPENEIKLCSKGFHACRKPLESLQFYGDRFFIVEARGKIVDDKDTKFVASEMRLVIELPTAAIFKRFTIFCAKQCLSNYEKEYPEDSRISDCIVACEDYLNGKITLMKLNSAADSAMSAADSAMSSRSAAMSAADSADSAMSAMSSRSAVRSAARSAESAAESEWSAAMSAESAWLTAWSAARSLESARSAQNKFLTKLIKQYTKNTPDDIKRLNKNEIFVFGSNESGKHDGGAAKHALDKFDAEYGNGEGLQGKSYAFPTLDKNFKQISIKQLKKSVTKLNKCAKENPYKIFLLTKVGCGIGSYKEEEIKKLFKNMELNVIKPKGW